MCATIGPGHQHVLSTIAKDIVTAPLLTFAIQQTVKPPTASKLIASADSEPARSFPSRCPESVGTDPTGSEADRAERDILGFHSSPGDLS
jgi:hypothetical protein